MKSTWIDGIDDAALHQLLRARASRQRAAGAATGADRPGFVFLRPPCRGDDCPDFPPDRPPPPDDPCRGQTWVWQPDLAARLITNDACPTTDSLHLLETVVGGNLSQFKLPDPDVRASCNNGVIDILIWGNKVAATSCSELARRRAQIPDDIASGGSFGVYVSASLVRRLAQAAFDAAPKRLYANGLPGPDGPIHLTGMSVAFQAPNVVKTIVTGYDERPWPDVGFTTTITDTLHELRTCTTDVSTDASTFDEVLAALFAAITGAITVFVPALFPIPAFVLINDLSALDTPSGQSDGGAGCGVMEGLPDQIALPQTGGIVATSTTGAMARVNLGDHFPHPVRQKIVIPYNAPRVDERGILVSALATKADRHPAASVAGPSSLLIDVNAQSAFALFGAHDEDFYGRRSYAWTGGTGVVIANPTARSTKITFLRGTAKPGDHFDRTVSVKVTDVEGSTASASLTLTVFVAEPGDTLPPVCKVKPWLAICSPGD